MTRFQIQHWRNNITLFSRAVQVTEKNAIAQFNLGQALKRRGNIAESRPHFEETVRLSHRAQTWQLHQTFKTDALFNIGLAWIYEGELDKALQSFSEVARLNPKIAAAYFEIGLIQGLNHKSEEAVKNYREAIRLEPDHAKSLNNLARILATSSDESIRNGPEAIVLAKRACDLTKNQDHVAVGTLSAAYAESGQFEKAILTAEQAKTVAIAAGQSQIANDYARWIELYRFRQAVRE